MEFTKCKALSGYTYLTSSFNLKQSYEVDETTLIALTLYRTQGSLSNLPKVTQPADGRTRTHIRAAYLWSPPFLTTAESCLTSKKRETSQKWPAFVMSQSVNSPPAHPLWPTLDTRSCLPPSPGTPCFLPERIDLSRLNVSRFAMPAAPPSYLT